MASHSSGGTAFNDAVIEVFLPYAGCSFSYLNTKKDSKSFQILKNIIKVLLHFLIWHNIWKEPFSLLWIKLFCHQTGRQVQ